MDINYILGLIEGEGNFLYKEYKREKQNQTQSKFQIGMHIRDYNLLCKVKEYLKMGEVRQYIDTTFFTITKLSQLKELISIIDKAGGFYGNKKEQYIIWKEKILTKCQINKI